VFSQTVNHDAVVKVERVDTCQIELLLRYLGSVGLTTKSAVHINSQQDRLWDAPWMSSHNKQQSSRRFHFGPSNQAQRDSKVKSVAKAVPKVARPCLSLASFWS
jgi:hypothetical protein